MLKRVPKLFISGILLFYIFIDIFASNNINTSNYNFSYNDTIWVYDTIVVYDTVWIYDTVYVDRDTPLEKLAPINIRSIEGHKNTSNIQLAFNNFTKSNDEKLSQLKQKTQKRKKANNNRRYRQHLIKSNFNNIKNNNGNKSFILNNLDMELYGGPVFQKTEYKQDSVYHTNDSLINNTTNLVGLKCGIRFTYQANNLSLTTGVGIAQSREKHLYYEIPDNIGYQIYNSKNTHLLLEFPVIGAYHFQYPHTDFNLKFGAINQFHLKSNGKLNSLNNTVEDINAIDFTSYNLSIYAGIEGSYNLTKRMSVGIEAYYQYPLKKFAQINKLSIYKQFYGVNLTLAYKLVIHE